MCRIQFVFISIAAIIAGVTTPKNVFAIAVRIFQKLSVHFCIYLLFWEFCYAVHDKTTNQNIFIPTLLCSFLWYFFSRKLDFKN
jgi:hypothetical protein